MKYYPTHMHLHASHEPSASISSHMEWAKRLGIRYIWLTEHDSRIGRKKKPLDSFVFLEDKLTYTLPSGIKAGFTEEEGSCGSYSFFKSGDFFSLSVIAKKGEREELTFKSSGKNHSEPLLADVAVELDADFSVNQDASVVFEIILSKRPPDFSHARLVYYLGNAPEREEGHIQYVPFPERTDGKYIFNISSDAGEEVGGLDNALCYIKLILVGGSSEAECIIRRISFSRKKNANEAREAQKQLANALSEKYGVRAFVGFEITEAGKPGRHKNCFSTTVPVLDYEARGFNITEREAAEHVISNGGIFSYNHALTELYEEGLTVYQKKERVLSLARSLAACKLFGASVLEVGFPNGRDGFDYRLYSMLWDSLSMSGVFVTADGDSDNHGAEASGWTEGNNFATYIGLSEDEHPCEENIVKSLRRGTVYAADPTKNVVIDISSDGYPAGSVRVGKRCDISFYAEVSVPSRVITVVNGNAVRWEDYRPGVIRFSEGLLAWEKYNFIRFEICDSEGRLIAISNPIYLVRDASDIPPEAECRKV